MNTYEELVFLQDEVRDGFYIPTAVKQAWIEELYILKEIDAVCKKHRITYFADWGTQLALVRHGGFIPWDDDLDICMKREDYENFRAHQDELPEGFFVQDYSNTDDHWFYIAKVVSQNHISFDEEFLKEHHNFPYMVNVDIFILDYVYADREKEKQRDSDILTILALADGIRERTMSDESAADILKKLNDSLGTSYAFDGTDGSRHDLSVALYSLSERLMQTASESESDCVTNIFPWGLKQMFYREKSIYAETVNLPYENTSIPTSTEYNRLTGELYHNYMEVHKNWDGHTYPFFESQKKELEELNGGRLPFEFSFDASMLRKSYPSEMREPNEKRQVVFLVTGRGRWKAFSTFLRDEEKEGSEITVTYLPFFFKEPDGTIITFVLCYELISMLTEKNTMHDIDTWMFFKYFAKMWIAVFIVSHTFDITMAVFDVGKHVVNSAAGVISRDTTIDVSGMIQKFSEQAEAMGLAELFVLALETFIVSFGMKILSVVITVILYARMIEIYLYISVSPVTFSTFGNRDWGQIGNNYLKGLFALAFQGFFMIICVGIYAVIVSMVQYSDNLHLAMFEVGAYTVILCLSLMKTGNLAKEVFCAR